MVDTSIRVGAVLGSLVVLSLPLATARVAHRASAQEPKPITVSGCLEKGQKPDEFLLTGKDGKKYEVISKSVKLEAHVGHSVKVKGTVAAEGKGEKAEKGEAGHLQAISLEHVSPTCTTAK